MKYIAFVTKGIEGICRKEMTSIKGLTILSARHKHIRFEYDGDPLLLGKLRTVDDIALSLGEFSTNELSSGNYENIFDLKTIQEVMIPLIGKFRTLGNNFAITISSYRSRELDKEILKNSIQDFLSKSLNLTYTEKDHSNLDFRINTEEDTAFASLKLFPESLFRRDYDHKTSLGSLHSTIAAAMIFEILSKLKKDKDEVKLVDNMCGSGTFLCEGHLMGVSVAGGDISAVSVDLAKENLEKVGVKNPEVFIQDAQETKWPNEYFDIAVTNFPWNKQVNINHFSRVYEGVIKEYARVLKKDGIIGLIGVKPELIKKYMQLSFPNYTIKEYRIGYLGQMPSILIASALMH